EHLGGSPRVLGTRISESIQGEIYHREFLFHGEAKPPIIFQCIFQNRISRKFMTTTLCVLGNHKIPSSVRSLSYGLRTSGITDDSETLALRFRSHNETLPFQSSVKTKLCELKTMPSNIFVDLPISMTSPLGFSITNRNSGVFLC